MSALLSFADVGVALGKTPVVEGVSFEVRVGDVVALLGANGAGKTTLLRAGLGFVRASTGSIALGGDDPHALSPRVRARRAAYLPQKPAAVWPIAVESIVALGRFAHGAAPERLGGADRAAVDAALEACGLTHLRARRIDAISGGERMRAHLARTLAQGAPLMLLDEPTASLDPAQAIGVSDIVRAHASRGGAVVFSTHDIALAARTASRVIVLKNGRVIADGAPDAALSREAIGAAYGRNGALVRIGDGVAAAFD